MVRKNMRRVRRGLQNAVKSLGHPEYVGISPEMGFATGAEPEVMAAQYASGANHGGLLLDRLPESTVAEQHLRHLAGVIPGGKPVAALERKGSVLSVVIAPSSATNTRAKLRQSINYETQVTWNEPSTTATDPPIVSTLVKIFIGTGVFMLVAVVLGVAFGGVRVLTKNFFPARSSTGRNRWKCCSWGCPANALTPAISISLQPSEK